MLKGCCITNWKSFYLVLGENILCKALVLLVCWFICFYRCTRIIMSLLRPRRAIMRGIQFARLQQAVHFKSHSYKNGLQMPEKNRSFVIFVYKDPQSSRLERYSVKLQSIASLLSPHSLNEVAQSVSLDFLTY